ncbi:(d)CMP kinase [Patescibacteria group bacterium]|nr:(d)CMP kinase [Patescibacteria group bacterium]
MKGFIVAIDGPVAAGKGTIAPLLAKKLNGFYLYTGGMYRSLALYCLENGIDIKNEEAVIRSMPNVKIELTQTKVFLNDKDVTQRIKDVDVARATPYVASITSVRQEMVVRQREASEKIINHSQPSEKMRLIVAEGRDVATKIFPNADLKVFLTASPEKRATRRLAQIRQQGSQDISYEQVLSDIKKRDEQDKKREEGPLISNPQEHGYFVVDNTDLSEDATLEAIVAEMGKKGFYDNN